jgi:predicted Zn finger-like uncharacterized protein
VSLATRCTACGTIFRVVQDQLKVSEGWVRCGRCQQVFNALQCLFDLEREAPPPWPPEPATWDRTTPVPRDTGTAAAVPLPGRDHDNDNDNEHEHEHEQDTVAESSFPSTQSPVSEPPALPLTEAPVESPFDAPMSTQPLLRRQSRDDTAPAPAAAQNGVHATVEGAEDHGFADARFNPDLVDDEQARDSVPSLPATLSRPSAFDEPPDTEMAADLPQLVDEPSFVRAADRDARWQRRPVRTMLWTAGALLAVLLAAQLLVLWRDTLAARWPAVAPVLQALCGLSGCRIEPPRQLEQLAVAGTALSRAGAVGQYRLVVTLSNHAPVALMLPALELTLSDAQGALVARKVLLPQDLGPQRTVPAHGELTLQAALSTGGTPVVGYAVEIFYP